MSPIKFTLAALLFSTLSALPGCSTPTYSCTSNSECTASGNGAQCLIEVGSRTGVCVESNAVCASGLRYSRSAPNPLQCVDTNAGHDASLDGTTDGSIDVATDMITSDLPDGSSPETSVDASSTDASDSGPTDAGPPSECVVDPMQRNCDCIFTVHPAPANQPAAIDNGPCSLRILAPLSQRLSTGRSTKFRAGIGANITSANLEFVQLGSGNVMPTTQVMDVLAAEHAVTTRFEPINPAVYALRWRIVATCGAETVRTPYTVVALPRPYRRADCTAPCVSPVQPIAANIDLNSDGRSDLVVGQNHRLTVKLTSSVGAEPVPLALCLPPSIASPLGRNIEAVGDLDDDGFSDFLVSSCTLTDSLDTCGNVAVAYGGGPRGIEAVWSVPTIVPQVGLTNCRVGATLSVGGDFNDDGYADALVGTPCENGGQVNIVFGHPSRAPWTQRLNLDAVAMMAIQREQMFGSGLAIVRRGSADYEIATLSKASVRVLSVTSALNVSEAHQLANTYATYSAMRWQGMTGVLGPPENDPGVVGVSSTTWNSNAGVVVSMRYTIGIQIPAQDVQAMGSPGNLFGTFIAGPMDLNNDGRGDVLSLAGGLRTAQYLIGGVSPSIQNFAVVAINGSMNFQGFASVGNVSSPLIDSVAVSVLDGNRSSVIRLCQRQDAMDMPMDMPTIACQDLLTLPVVAPASIAGR